MKANIISCGSYLPKKILTNLDLEKMVDTSDEWIFERTGIKERHIVAEGETTSDMALQASLRAIEKINLPINEIDMVLVATTTPDKTFPSTAVILQQKLGIKESAFAFDVQAVCSGFVYALTVADGFIQSGKAKNILLVGSDSNSKITNWTDRNTCCLFGDGAGAVILKAKEGNSGILATSLHSDGQYESILNTSGGVSSTCTTGTIHMEGREVFKLAVNKMSDCVIESLNKINLTTGDISWLIPHQANQRIIAGVGKKLNMDDSKVVSTVRNHANTSAASIPLALDTMYDKIQKGDIVVFEALGGGLTWGSVVVKW